MTKVFAEALPNREAQQFWRNKVKLGPGQFAKLSDEAKTMAFGISGIAKGDELTGAFNSLQRAVDAGITFDDFKKDCAATFERRGWTGKRAWRVDNIFRTNIQTAYNVGKWKQVQDTNGAFPYLRYSAIHDSRTRPTHRAIDGMIFPVDHPFWDHWYPPNGYRCRCTVTALTQGMMDRRGFKVTAEDPTGKPIMPPGATNPVQLLPDPGFDYNPGKVVWGGMDRPAGESLKWEDMPNLHTAADFKRRALANVRPAQMIAIPEQILPAGETDDFYISEFIRRYGEDKLLTDAAGESVLLSLRSFMQDKTPGATPVWKFYKPGHGEGIPLLQDMIEKPFEIWLTPQINGEGQIRLTKRYIALWKSPDKERLGGFMSFDVVEGNFQGVTAFTPFRKGKPDLRYLEKQRQGLLLYGSK